MMRVDWKSALLGAAGAVAALFAAAALLLTIPTGGPSEAHHRTLRLVSGRTLEVTALYLGFGDPHSSRGSIDDDVEVEYVTSAADGAARDQEASEVFEAIRPLVESLGVGSASVAAFPSLLRKGHYQRRLYTRDAGGAWTPTRSDAKVFVND
jgi:hypothetical protein